MHTLFLLLAILILAFAFRWQVVEGQKFSDLLNQRSFSAELDSQRGAIFFADGATMAYSEPRFDVYVWMGDIEFFEQRGIQTREEFIRKIAPLVNLTDFELRQKFIEAEVNKIMWFQIAKSVSRETFEEINSLTTDAYPLQRLVGVIMDIMPRRVYPEGRVAAHIAGLTNMDEKKFVGVGGIEGSYNGVLNPIKGFLRSETDAIGQTVASSLQLTIEPRTGASVYTTIKKHLQETIEKKLAEDVKKYEAKSGTIAIMDPKNGEMLALANFPDYDPNLILEEDVAGITNSAIIRPYEAGSIGKLLTVAIGIELGTFDADTVIQPEGHQGCETIHIELPPLCTWNKRPMPPMSAKECFARSDNLCFFHMAKQFDKQEYYNFLSDFGIGKSTGIDLGLGDSYGLLKDYSNWNIADIAAYSYGHGYQINVIQGLSYTATIANHGVKVQPRVAKKIVRSNGEEVAMRPIVEQRVVSVETAAKVTDMMRYNFETSIAPNEFQYFHLKNYDLGVKSGTALVAEGGVYTGDINASFIGYDASPERTFAMLVWLEKPQIPEGDLLAYYNVRPMWLETFHLIKDILRVPTKR